MVDHFGKRQQVRHSERRAAARHGDERIHPRQAGPAHRHVAQCADFVHVVDTVDSPAPLDVDQFELVTAKWMERMGDLESSRRLF